MARLLTSPTAVVRAIVVFGLVSACACAQPEVPDEPGVRIDDHLIQSEMPPPAEEPAQVEPEVAAADIIALVHDALVAEPIRDLRIEIEGDTLRLHGVAATVATVERAMALAQEAAPALEVESWFSLAADDLPTVNTPVVAGIVKEAIAETPDLAALISDFEIEEVDNRLVLTGIAASVDARDDVEDLVEAAAPGVPIENRIAVVLRVPPRTNGSSGP